MNRSLDVADTYPGRTVGRAFVSEEIKAARDDIAQMIKDAGFAKKIAALIIPNGFHPTSYDALGISGQHIVTLWGRTPSTDEAAVRSLIMNIKSKHGEKFIAGDHDRAGPDRDVVVSPYLFYSTAAAPRTW